MRSDSPESSSSNAGSRTMTLNGPFSSRKPSRVFGLHRTADFRLRFEQADVGPVAG